MVCEHTIVEVGTPGSFLKASPEDIQQTYHTLDAEPDAGEVSRECAHRLEQAKQNILDAQQKQKTTKGIRRILTPRGVQADLKPVA